MRYALRIHGAQFQLRARLPGQSWQVIDAWPLGVRAIPERCFSILSPNVVMQLEKTMSSLRISTYTPLDRLPSATPTTMEGWLVLMTHLCWQIRSEAKSVGELMPLVVAVRRLTDSLHVMGAKLPPRRKVTSRARKLHSMSSAS